MQGIYHASCYTMLFEFGIAGVLSRSSQGIGVYFYVLKNYQILE
jgi:hypothetical protein